MSWDIPGTKCIFLMDAERAAAAQPTPPATSPRRSLAATAIIASLTGAVSIPPPTSTPVPSSLVATPPPSTATPATLSSNVVTPTAPLPGPPLGIETRPARKPVNTSVPKGPSTQSRGRGRGRGRRAKGGGGRGGGRGRGGGVGKENSTEDATNSNPDPNVYQPGLLSPASRRRIDTLNKRVYALDGTYHGLPLGAWHSLNADGLHPCVTFTAPPPPAAPKKCSWDVVSEELILPGKRARKERMRSN